MTKLLVLRRQRVKREVNFYICIFCYYFDRATAEPLRIKFILDKTECFKFHIIDHEIQLVLSSEMEFWISFVLINLLVVLI